MHWAEDFYNKCSKDISGFEFTGEFRAPRRDEWFLCDRGYPLKCQMGFAYAAKRLILKKLAKTFEFDGQTFECPEGFDFVRVGFFKESDVEAGYYHLCFFNNTNKPTPHPIKLAYISGTTQAPFFIFKKEGE